MPAFYAHYRFGAKVASQLNGDLKNLIQTYHAEFSIGLQGPDILFFYRPIKLNSVNKIGYHIHDISALSFFDHARSVIERSGKNSREYAYLLGFVCHFMLDSECHPYVASYIEKSGLDHMEIEEEFEKALLRLDQKNPFSYPIAKLVPRKKATVQAIAPFYEDVSEKIILESLYDLSLVKKLFTAPGVLKHALINFAFKLSGNYAKNKGLMNQHKDNPLCEESNLELLRRFRNAIPLTVAMLNQFDICLEKGVELPKRFDRTFE